MKKIVLVSICVSILIICFSFRNKDEDSSTYIGRYDLVVLIGSKKFEDVLFIDDVNEIKGASDMLKVIGRFKVKGVFEEKMTGLICRSKKTNCRDLKSKHYSFEFIAREPNRNFKVRITGHLDSNKNMIIGELTDLEKFTKFGEFTGVKVL